jgi:hypothetical protein
MTDADSDQLALREIYAAERKQLLIDIAAREQQIQQDKLQAVSRTDTVTKSYNYASAPASRRSAAPAATSTEGWRNFIMQQIDRREQSATRAMARAIAQSIGMDVIALEKRCAVLEAELAELKKERGTKLRSVPPGDQMIA